MRTIKTDVGQLRLNDSESLVVFSSQINSKHINEQQKFEVEGLDQPGMNGIVRMVESENQKLIQYEMFLKHSEEAFKDHRPIFIKISAN